MPESTSDNNAGGSKLNAWVQQHKKSIIVAAVLFGAIIVWMIARHSSHGTNPSSGTGSVNTNAANAGIPAVGGPYYGGGEFGGGYATANNYGQLAQQLASINTTLNALANGNHPASSGGSGNSTPTSPGQGGGGLRPGGKGIPPSAPTVVSNPGFNLQNMTITQAEAFLAQHGGSYYISNISAGNNQYNPGNNPNPNAKIVSFTPYSNGTVRVGV